MKRLFTGITQLAVATLFVLIAASAPAQEFPPADNADAYLPGQDSPAGETALLRAPGTQRPQPLTPWIERIGTRKGITDHELEQEMFAGPDGAVLKRGFFEPWQGLLTEFLEPFVEVEAGTIAGLEKSKRYLIIPTGALEGASSSEFFKAGLAEFAESGGVIICFAQRFGADYSGLPVPNNETLEAAGWTQDAGPLFRASVVQNQHPLLASIRKTTPHIETSGYLRSYPRNAKVLLARPDGFPTFVLYPFGAGWVVVTTLFSDVSYDQGMLDPVEKALIRDLLFWARSPAQVVQAMPGEHLNFNLTIPGPEQGEASQVRLMVLASDNGKIMSARVAPLSIKTGQSQSLAFTFDVPADARPGTYHMEYILQNPAGQDLSSRIETEAGRFSVGQPAAMAPLPRQNQALTAFPAQFRVQPSLDRTGDKLKVNFDILLESKSMLHTGQDFFVRVAGQEKTFRLTDNKAAVSLDVSGDAQSGRIAYALYHSSGRSLARGALPVIGPAARGVFARKAHFLSGSNAQVMTAGLGGGELTIRGQGIFDRQVVAENADVEFPLPAGLPTGTYRLAANYLTLDGGVKRGDISINVLGNVVQFQDAALEIKSERGAYSAAARLKITAAQKALVHVKLSLKKPDGSLLPAAERDVTLAPGMQETLFSFPFKPEQAGMWELRYEMSVQMPKGPGRPAQSMVIASGQKLFDAGDAALLGLAPALPIYYEPKGPVDVSALVYGRGAARIEILVDGKRVRKEQRDLSGAYAFTATLTELKPGPHIIKAALKGASLESVREIPFIYGARLPDLTANLKLADQSDVLIPIGIGVQNLGRMTSRKSRASVYDGDPAKGGTLIATLDIPQLESGQQEVSLIDWSLYKKAGRRTLYAVADTGNVVEESNKKNNTASVEVTIPDILLLFRTHKKVFTSDENIPLVITAANFTTTAYQDLRLTIQVTDSAGKSVFSDSVALPEFPPDTNKTLNREIQVPAIPVGSYKASVQIFRNEISLADFSSLISILPTLLLKGALDGTPPIASLCRPFTMRYRVQSTGNIQPSAGSHTLEIRAKGGAQPVYAKQLPAGADQKTVTIDAMDFPRGNYTISLKASAVNQQYGISKDFSLGERSFTVAGPLDVRRNDAKFLRVLVWTGQSGIPVDQAVAEKIVTQAFDQENIYYRIVDRADDFIAQAATGAFNAFVLFETTEMLEKTDWLRNRIESGYGLVIIGSGEKTRAVAESLDYRFEEEAPDTTTLIALSGDSGLGLSGTIPASGRILSPWLKGAATAAEFTGSRHSAAIIGKRGKGTAIVMPFSFTRSARDSGTTSLYSLLLRSTVNAAAPKEGEPGGTAAGELSVSSPSGSARARLVETLPAGSRVIWTNGGVASGSKITYEFTSDPEPRILMYLFQPGNGKMESPSAEAFFECNGKFVSQGKVE